MKKEVIIIGGVVIGGVLLIMYLNSQAKNKKQISEQGEVTIIEGEGSGV